MKKGFHKHEFDEIDGLTKKQAEKFAEKRLAYPEFRIIIARIANEIKVIIEVHVAELGEDSNFFTASVNAKYFLEGIDNQAESILGPMLSRLNKDILAEVLKEISL